MSSISKDKVVIRLFLYSLLTFFLITLTKVSAQEYWQRLPGPSHSVVYDFLATQSGNIICGTFLGGLYSTANKGANWTHLEASVSNNARNYFSKVKDGVYLASGWGILKSTDDGETWNSIGLENDWFMSVVSFNDSIYIAGGVAPKTFRTSNGGITWTQLFNDSIPSGTVYSLKVKDGVIYYVGWNRVYKSLDSGVNWIKITPTDHYTTYYDLTMTDDNILFCATDDSTSKIYKSSDFGETWTASGNGITADYVRKLEIVNNKLIAGTPTGIYVSNDYGDSWTLQADYFASGNIRALRVIENDIYAGTYFGGAYKSTDNGENWIEINSGLDACSVRNFFTANNSFYAFTGYGGISYTTIDENSWTIKIRNSSFSNVDFASTGYMFGSTSMHGVMRSTNDGHFWEFVNNGLTDTAISKILVNEQDVVFAFTASGKLFRSTNFGDQWVELMNSPYKKFLNILFTENNSLLAYDSENIFISTDNGSSWETKSLFNQFILAKLFLVKNDLLFAISDGDSLFVSSNRGDNWLLVNSDMLPYVLSLVKDKNDRLFCISGDIYVSEDGGISWNILDYGIENKNISSLGVDNLGNVYAGTSYTGTYKLVDTPVSVENSNENIINDFGLLQNYPNPFNPTTIIYFRLPVSGFVTLKVYDILGREVALLLNENKLAGNYEVEFNAKNIPSGVYFYTLSAGEFKETRKMLFMK